MMDPDHPASAPEPCRADPRRAFVAFSGGGAKGIAHIGALKALEQRGVHVMGYAGTSAGAIIASLAASGFQADEIMHPVARRSILDSLAQIDNRLKAPTDLFGPGAWLQIAILRTLMVLATGRRVLVCLVLILMALLASFVAVGASGFPAAFWIIGFWLLSGTAFALVMASGLSGLAKLHTLRNALAGMLTSRLFPDEPDRKVLFSDFDGVARPALKVVAANLTHRRLELFSADTTPTVEIADAIAASICLPVIFDLWTFESGKFVDGGIVSNLPAWPFDEERELDGNAMTIAFAIGGPMSDGRGRDGPGRLSWLPSLIQTSLFGSASLSLRAVGPSELITLRPQIKMMDFDLGYEEAQELLADMTKAALAEIDTRLFRFPETYREACWQVVRLTEATFERARQILQKGSPKGRVRSAVAMRPQNYLHSLRLRFGANFGEDTDQDMLLPLDGSLVGVAWKEGQPQFDIAPFPEEFKLTNERHRALRRRVWPDLAWSLRVPILASDGEIRYVVTVDGSHRLHDTGETREVFEGLTDEVTAIFQPLIEKLGKWGFDGKTED